MRRRVRRVLLVRQEDRLRDRDAGGERDDVVEVLVVGGPPDRVVHDLNAARDGALEERPVERDLVADPVEDHGVLEGLLLDEDRDLDGPRLDVVAGSLRELVDLVHQRPREGVFHPEEHADPFPGHVVNLSLSSRGILADARDGPQSRRSARLRAHEARIRFVAERRPRAADGVPLVRRPRASGPRVPDVDGTLLPERGLRPHGRARRQGRRGLPPADLRRLRRRGELVRPDGSPARPRAAPRRLRPLPP